MALTTAITLAGNLTEDPELRESQNGKPFARVSIAVNPREFDREAKEWKDGEAVYWRGTVFGDLAEHVAHSLRKGNRVIVHGVVKSDSWTDKNSGTKRTDKVLQIEDIGPSLMFANAAVGQSLGRSSSVADPIGSDPTGAPSDDTPF